ncbi:probable inactive leucine-rich repeat receptor-like protein kinase At3g03770 [Macadamia integrifolia]|uniref:probable inactive leucine-rich repeat receptor-like protein kinase At3g03770 n=1 Tax=Macadamia integrifolia TaxID=60698 RepID=UPI001C528F34|nr:probable inactive leucine-rich repeat receptor-like protein kinase At3g03770 [Macadamia integrifolia]XP_042476660.1 probable inactive leucine-rich repeat receptor-like protein kinase At3g03770 [Macadamia integrifolia]XP_042476661.1 probable inactive leucine-rich repeat receptor-like protein kinase At3g03770 [Macadamia integrifolia]XP_042476662.1 probable inactive leucine-rich repeat receptor-like protein kinase At3g03770 [Macadamia integrifolia]
MVELSLLMRIGEESFFELLVRFTDQATMANATYPSYHLLVFIVFLLIPHSNQLQSSHAHTLLRIKLLLNFPKVLRSWNENTDFCNTDPNPNLTVVCYEETITQLHIIGNRGTPSLPRNFSIDSFFTTLVRLPSLKVLSLVSLGLWGPLSGKISRLSSLEILNVSSNFLSGTIPREISSMGNLQTLILDDNMFTNNVPDWLGELSILAVLSLKNNSLSGHLPKSLGTMENLRVLSVSMNRLSGPVPDLSRLTNLQVLDLEDNYLGPQFPSLGSKLVRIVLRKNRFSSGIPSEVSSCYQLQWLDISFNRFMGPFPPWLFSLPSITYLNVAENKFTGLLSINMSCNAQLTFVDLSSNLLSGSLPNCLLMDSKNRVALYDGNCLTTGNQNQNQNQNQHPYSFCRNEALAVGILPHKQEPRRAAKVIIAVGVVGGVLGGAVLVGLLFLAYRVVKAKVTKMPPTKLITVNASTGYTSKLLSDARYISQTMKLGALGLPAYRTFSLEELEEAIHNFNSSTFMGEGSHGQIFRGKLSDSSLVVIRCLKVKRRYSTQHFMHHIELISKLRHRHLVSALGHCFECDLDDSSVSRIFLIFEYVANGTLRSRISEGFAGQRLTWTQRIGAAIGIAKGIQFLHTGIVPGVFSNNLKITDVLLDQNLVAKISSYNLHLLAENMEKAPTGVSPCRSKELIVYESLKHVDKVDIYDFGVILLEIIVGRPITYLEEVDVLKDQLHESIMADDADQRSIIDLEVRKACLYESLKTVTEICIRCLSKEPTERPSVEDVLWNLQFAAQVQDSWRGDSQSSDGSPVSSSQPPVR